MKKTILSLLLLLTLTAQLQAQGVGSWRAYMAYSDVTEIEKAGATLYVLASGNLYSYNTGDQSLQTYDKVNALSDCQIAHIAWSAAARRLVIVYDNQNIDLLSENGGVTNLSDYQRASLTQDKTVYGIDMAGNEAYLATGFGLLRLNVARGEVSETYDLGFRVDYSYLSDGYLYAASSTHGLYRALTSANLLDRSSWSRVGEYVARPKELDPQLLQMVQTLQPGGPKYNHFGFMKMHHNRLYTCGGGYNVVQDLERPGCVQVLSGTEWTIYQDSDISQQTGAEFIDLNCLDIDPRDDSHLFTAGRTGLYEFNGGRFTRHYSCDNSPLASAFTSDKNYVMVQGLTFDGEGNLWVLNSMNSQQNLLQLSADGQWQSHRNEALLNDGSGAINLSKAMMDSRGLLWFVNDSYRYPALYCYQPSSETVLAYHDFINEDGTRVEVIYPRCIAEDREGNLWLGTNAGPLYLQSTDVGAPVSDVRFQQYKVPRNDGTDLADYLLSGIDITCMAVDDGNRKWFGTTGNGVYLISSDNNTQLQHFTSANSPLLSDNIESIALNKATGEVFFGTDRGLCSYMGDAQQTVEKMDKDVTYAYPNPVTPDYTGPITITGLTYDADVKIVTSHGVVVNEGRSNGGTYVWDGTDQQGRRVASGVYMVLTATSEGKKGTVCKIAIVN